MDQVTAGKATLYTSPTDAPREESSRATYSSELMANPCAKSRFLTILSAGESHRRAGRRMKERRNLFICRLLRVG